MNKYTVKPGDDWLKIAKAKYGDETAAQAIVKANAGTVNTLREGMNIKLPTLTPTVTPPTKPTTPTFTTPPGFSGLPGVPSTVVPPPTAPVFTLPPGMGTDKTFQESASLSPLNKRANRNPTIITSSTPQVPTPPLYPSVPSWLLPTNTTPPAYQFNMPPGFDTVTPIQFYDPYGRNQQPGVRDWKPNYRPNPTPGIDPVFGLTGHRIGLPTSTDTRDGNGSGGGGGGGGWGGGGGGGGGGPTGRDVLSGLRNGSYRWRISTG